MGLLTTCRPNTHGYLIAVRQNQRPYVGIKTTHRPNTHNRSIDSNRVPRLPLSTDSVRTENVRPEHFGEYFGPTKAPRLPHHWGSRGVLFFVFASGHTLSPGRPLPPQRQLELPSAAQVGQVCGCGEFFGVKCLGGSRWSLKGASSLNTCQ